MHRHRISIGLVAALLALLVTAAFLFLRPAKVESPVDDGQRLEQPQVNRQQNKSPADVQSVIDSWGARQTGEYSIVVYDLDNKKTIGSHRPDEVYFAASIYKLYVAYEGLRAVQQGELDPYQPYVGDYDLATCLHEMIHSSDSPCAEKLWEELGKEQLDEKLKTYGLKNTSMVNITTTAQDAATLLIRLHEHKDLAPAQTRKMIASMESQIYRNALVKGFSEVEFYDKVGFRGLVEYHDVGILELPDGRSYVVSLFTKDIGTRAMADLAEYLYRAFEKEPQ